MKTKKIYILYTIIGIWVIGLVLLLRYSNSMAEEVSYSTNIQEKAPVHQYEPVKEEIPDIQKVIEENRKESAKKTEEIVKEEVDLEYITKYENNNNLSKDTVRVIQEGIDGKQQIVWKRIYEEGELVEEEQIGTIMIKPAIPQIVEVGTGNYRKTSKVKVGETLYVTSDLLSIREEPTRTSDKLITLQGQEQVILLEVSDNYYKVKYGNFVGYAEKDCLTNEKQEQEKIEEESAPASPNKQTVLQNLRKDMPLNKPSGLSLEQFKKILTDKKDKNKVFEENAAYFYYIEKQYQINGVFVAAVGIHESAWGTSSISLRKKNLFGYGAYDRNPGQNAYSFEEYAEGIDLLARVFTKYYINPKGTSIYGGEKAVASHYHGATVEGVNHDYATDKNWNNKVYEWMSYLYHKV